MSAPVKNNGASGNNAGGYGDDPNGLTHPAGATNAAGTPIKTKFGSYEAQARLLAAVVASLEDKGVKLDYKRVAFYLGEDTKNPVEHEFRKVRVRAKMAKELGDRGERGEDPFMIPDAEFLGTGPDGPGTEKAEKLIHKYFNASTPGGTEFKFREVRKQAAALKEAAAIRDQAKGGGAPVAPPTKTPTKTPRKRTASATAASTSAARKKAKKIMIVEDDFSRMSSGLATPATMTPATTMQPSPTPEVGGWTPGQLQQQGFPQHQQQGFLQHPHASYIPTQQEYLDHQQYFDHQQTVAEQLKREADEGHELHYYTPEQRQSTTLQLTTGYNQPAQQRAPGSTVTYRQQGQQGQAGYGTQGLGTYYGTQDQQYQGQGPAQDQQYQGQGQGQYQGYPTTNQQQGYGTQGQGQQEAYDFSTQSFTGQLEGQEEQAEEGEI